MAIADKNTLIVVGVLLVVSALSLFGTISFLSDSPASRSSTTGQIAADSPLQPTPVDNSNVMINILPRGGSK
jgi:hypothetical protein